MFDSSASQADLDEGHIFRNLAQERNTDDLELATSEEEIRRSINSLNLNRSGGPDGLCIEVFKDTIDDILPYIHTLINYIYDEGFFPEDWCKSIITPIHKSGPTDNPENYRTICLINCLCKIFMNIITVRLSSWADVNDVIDESQAGFPKGYSTIDNIFFSSSISSKIFM